MEGIKETAADAPSAALNGSGGGAHCGSVVVELPLGDAVAATFDLEKSVCSHGLFMMAPNHWDPLSKTLLRPLYLDSDDFASGITSSTPTSLIVRISHPSDSPLSLHLRVLGTHSLSPQHKNTLLAQVRRMLRLSELEDASVKEFQKMHGESKERGFGRVFRSPTLFEDMVKCILLCNCQWSRTLSMARALCELQLELQSPPLSVPLSKVNNGFVPKTPAGKESKRKRGANKASKNLVSRFSITKARMEAEDEVIMNSIEVSKADSMEVYKADSCLFSDIQSSEEVEHYCHNRIGNFPSPRDLASLDEKFLEKRCNLGYRAHRILKLAQSIVEGRIQLGQLEEACTEPSLSTYSKLKEQLKEIHGFGPFTCSNVLVCMGFYHVIPTDSETIRHLKQVRARNSTMQTVQRDVETLYGEYAPFQFLAYWSEVWNFYEEWFGKLSEMPHSDYKLITAANMRPGCGKSKRTKISQ